MYERWRSMVLSAKANELDEDELTDPGGASGTIWVYGRILWVSIDG